MPLVLPMTIQTEISCSSSSLKRNRDCLSQSWFRLQVHFNSYFVDIINRASKISCFSLHSSSEFRLFNFLVKNILALQFGLPSTTVCSSDIIFLIAPGNTCSANIFEIPFTLQFGSFDPFPNLCVD